MKKALIKLHIAILLAGLTGLFGKLILLNEFVLVWYRMLFVAVLLFIWLLISGKLKRFNKLGLKKMAIVGSIIGLHWVAFYGSIIHSNISIGVICLSACGFFSAILEPIILKKKIKVKELLLGLLAITGILLIFSFDTRYRIGIAYGLMAALLASTFTILNKKYANVSDSSNMVLYQMIFGFLFLTILIPLYIHIKPNISFLPTITDLLWMLVLSSICTIIPWIYQIEALRKVSAFTVNLSYNLEPIYSIILAFILFKEAKELNFSFYLGLIIIFIAVIIQTVSSIHSDQKVPEV
ncbi:MAG: DMT family transporter [Bacteroidales bacterium]